MAFQDPLTGLPNRAAMRDRIAKAVATARERQRALAILSVHVGHFDEISDTLGHAAGDRLMAEVAERVAAVARSGQDALARIGEDELVVLLRDADAAHASDVARRIVDALTGRSSSRARRSMRAAPWASRSIRTTATMPTS